MKLLKTTLILCALLVFAVTNRADAEHDADPGSSDSAGDHASSDEHSDMDDHSEPDDHDCDDHGEADDHDEFEPGDCDDDLRGPGGVCPLPGYRPTPPPETVPDYIAAVHAQYRYRVPADVASQAGYSPAMVRQLEQRVVELRRRTPYSLYRWSQMMRREINFDDASEARLHQLILQWESENANLRILRREAGLSDEDYGYRSNLNNEVLLAAVQAEISQELFERLAVDLRYPHE